MFLRTCLTRLKRYRSRRRLRKLAKRLVESYDRNPPTECCERQLPMEQCGCWRATETAMNLAGYPSEIFVGPLVLSNLGRTPDDPKWVDVGPTFPRCTCNDMCDSYDWEPCPLHPADDDDQ